MRINLIKKGLFLLTATICVSTLSLHPLHAADDSGTGGASSDYLKVIAQNTTNILAKVNTLPDYINTMIQFVVNMQKSDDSPSTSQMQANFATIGVVLTKDFAMQQGLQPQINNDLFGQGVNPPANKDELVYTSLLAAYDANSPTSKAVLTSAYNYMRNVSGLSLLSQNPSAAAKGYPADVYKAYFNTITSVKSYNAYVLSNRLAEMLNGNALSPSQSSLVSQASNSDWIAQIATEELGKVLRQLLVFQSQTYVLLSDMMQTQKQLLIAQTMTNTLLIAGSKKVESDLYDNTRSR